MFVVRNLLESRPPHLKPSDTSGPAIALAQTCPSRVHHQVRSIETNALLHRRPSTASVRAFASDFEIYFAMTLSLSGFPNNNPFPSLVPSNAVRTASHTPQAPPPRPLAAFWLDRLARAAQSLAVPSQTSIEDALNPTRTVVSTTRLGSGSLRDRPKGT